VTRVGIIGGGWIARRHVPAIEASPSLELVAATDLDHGRASAIAEPRGARAYTDWREMLDREALDALWVCTPPLHHRGPAVAALEAGIHVYLEKPIARTLEDAAAIVAAAERSAAVCAVGYQWHASELVDDVIAAVGDQSIGLLLGRNYGPVANRPWFADPKLGGGQVLERGSHHIDLQRSIAGEIATVTAIGGRARLGQAGAPADGIDDSIALQFEFEGGALGAVYSVWSRDGQPELYAMDVLADEATLAVELGPDAFRLTGVSRSQLVESPNYADPMERSIDRLVEVIASGDRARIFCSPQDALKTLAVAVACEQALATRETVAVANRLITVPGTFIHRGADLQLAGDQREAAGCVGCDAPKRAGALVGVDLRNVGCGHPQRRPVEDAVGRVLVECDLLEQLAVG
jgi:myo-inositol 2-dehydrogenase/D-chiro-inositol 1-dehydrogenase